MLPGRRGYYTTAFGKLHPFFPGIDPILKFSPETLPPGGSCDILFKTLGIAMFDSRCFNIPASEVVNCFVWRQEDATRNAIQMLGQTHFSHKELHKKSTSDIQEMLWQKGINFRYGSTRKCLFKCWCGN